MACGGFTCSKNSLIALNVLYIVVAFILIGVASYGRTSNKVTSISIVGGIIACGVFLLFIAILGLFGAVKHNQVFLFFYMIILFLLFIIQFGIACACLAVTHDQQRSLARTGWNEASNGTRANVQEIFNCCGFEPENRFSANESYGGHPSCEKVDCCKGQNETCCYQDEGCECETCYNKLESSINCALKGSGAVGLIFSLTEILGATISWRYRRMSDQAHVPLT